MRKKYDMFERFNGYAYGVNFNEGDWDIIINDKIYDVFDDEINDEQYKDFNKWIDENDFPKIDTFNGVKRCICFFEFTLAKEDKIVCNMNTDIFLKAKNYFAKHRDVIFKELKRLDEIYNKQEKFHNSLPEKILVQKWQLEPSIVIKMSKGLPYAYIQMLYKKEEIDGEYYYGICEAGSKMSEKTSVFLNNWCRIINDILEKNVKLFIGKMYQETAGDRQTVKEVNMGIPFDMIGVPSIDELLKGEEDDKGDVE